ncbi:MAG TPA: TolC family protein [Niastella sp.]|nr:TolC family protein [Niastella sp.]
MKMRLFISAFLILHLSVHAQNPLNLRYGSNPADSIPTDSIANGLARLAATNVNLGFYQANAEAAKYDYQAMRTSWLDNLRVSGNLNEFTIQGNNAPLNRNLFYPRYNIGATLPLGLFVNQGKKNKAEFYRYQAELEAIKVQQQNLRLQVITSYLNYIRNQKLYELQEEALQDAAFAFTKTEERFSKGEVELDVYTANSKRYNQEKVAKITAERDLILSKAELETLIGMPLDAALAKIKQAYRPAGKRR